MLHPSEGAPIECQVHVNSEEHSSHDDGCQRKKERHHSVFLLGPGAAAMAPLFQYLNTNVVVITPHRLPDACVPPVYLDLLQPDDVNMILQYMTADSPLFVCLSLAIRHHGHLNEEQQRKDRQLAESIHRIVSFLLHHHVPLALEAPRTSRVWKDASWSFIQQLLTFKVHVRPCRFDPASPRQRWLAIYSSVMWFLGLQGDCPHHEQQQRFDALQHDPVCEAYAYAFATLVTHDSTSSVPWSPAFSRKNQPRDVDLLQFSHIGPRRVWPHHNKKSQDGAASLKMRGVELGTTAWLCGVDLSLRKNSRRWPGM